MNSENIIGTQMELLKKTRSKKIRIAILNGLLYQKNQFKKGSILIENDRIKDVLFEKVDVNKLIGYTVIDADDSYVSYGFFDPHVHFRSPGYEKKEDWNTGSKSGIKGGFTFIVDMPNTNPPSTGIHTLVKKFNLARKTVINKGFYLGLTDENSNQIKDIYRKIKKLKIPVLGIKVFLGSSTGNLLVKKKKSIRNSLKTNLINLFHCEDEKVIKEYECMPYTSIFDHEKKRPVSACTSGIKKIIRAARKNKKYKIYICHVTSCKEVELIKKLRKKGYGILAEITPHHLYFNSSKFIKSNIYKVNPPIRSLENMLELRKQFNKGFFQIIGTDHAPHLLKEKESNNPPSGIPGLESAFYALYDLYSQKILSLEMIFKLLTSGYKIFKIKKRGKIKKNNFADIVIIKKEKNVFNSGNTYTKADFSPFDGIETNCKIDTVIINGKIILKKGEFIG